MAGSLKSITPKSKTKTFEETASTHVFLRASTQNEVRNVGISGYPVNPQAAGDNVQDVFLGRPSMQRQTMR